MQPDNPIAHAALYRRTLRSRVLALVIDMAELAIIVTGTAGLVLALVSMVGRYDVALILQSHGG